MSERIKDLIGLVLELERSGLSDRDAAFFARVLADIAVRFAQKLETQP